MKAAIAPARTEPTAPAVAFRAFYDAHVGMVWRALLRLGVAESDVPDRVQEVFIVAHRKLHCVSDDPRPWLWGIASRVARQGRRAHARWLRKLAALQQLPPAPPSSQTEHLVRRDEAVRLLQRLPTRELEAFVLTRLEGMTAEALGRALGVAASTIHTRVQNARARLLGALQEESR